jgi:hypothetical protein
MPANLTELKADVAGWLNRDDIDDADLGKFVRLGELQLDLFLRCRYTSKTTRFFVSNGLITIPDDYTELRIVQPVGTWDGADEGTLVASPQPPMTPVSFQSLAAYQSGSYPGYPANYAETPDGVSWAIYPAGLWAIDVSYYHKLPPLSDDNAATVRLFQAFPDVYLSAAMVEAENWLKVKEPDRGPWRGKLDAYITSLNGNSRRSEVSGGTLVTRSPYR